MATAEMTAPAPIGLDMSSLSNVAGTSVVDAYATRVLKSKSPPEVCIDESLGPYITSLLRHSLADMPGLDDDVANIPEYESLIELLEEHCSLSPETALSALQAIATAVRTGAVESLEEFPTSRRLSDHGTIGNQKGSSGSQINSPWRTSTAANHDNGMEPFSLLGDLTVQDPASTSSQDPDQPFFLEIQSSHGDNVAPLEGRDSSEKDDRSTSSGATGTSGTPLKPDRLIPVDLMGVLDDPSTPTSSKGKIDSFEFPPPGSIPPSSTKKGSSGKGRRHSKDEAKDLAAALFRPANVRQNSIDGEAKSPKLRAMSGPLSGLQYPSLEPSEAAYSNGTQYYHPELDSAVEILLSMNTDLGEEAAREAALVANMDVNVAQYVVDGAVSAPPVCRHLLKNGCYRSDCQFSHDVEGHTCLFWLRGRCGKGESCRFLHGYSEKLLEGINTAFLPDAAGDSGMAVNGTATSSRVKSEPLPIKTANLVRHNVNMSFSDPQHSGNPFTFMSSSNGFDASAFTFPPQAQTASYLESSWDPSPLEAAMKSCAIDQNKGEPGAGSSISFASIASKGYNDTSFAPGASAGIAGALEASSGQHQKSKFVKIPQDLWNPHHNRNATMFQISDPLERYREVSISVSRSDVIDLHFQSTKTFHVVLSTVLPEKLRDHAEVWVVTGTGHHVGKSTHQKGGGTLESAVSSWLASEGYNFVRGRDRNGHGGALLVKP